MNVAKANIVPKAININAWYDVHPARFLKSFLSRVAQLRHLESLTLTLDEFETGPSYIGKELLRAVRVNTNLKKLEFMVCEYTWGSYMQKLFGVLDKHESLRTFQIKGYPDHVDPEYKWLKRLLTQNRYLEVSAILYDEIQFDQETSEIYDLNRFFRGSKSLKKEPAFIRPFLVGSALADEYTCDFQYGGLLLTDHLDVFCELLQEAVPMGEADDANMESGDLPSAAASVTSTESSKGQKRQKTTD